MRRALQVAELARIADQRRQRGTEQRRDHFIGLAELIGGVDEIGGSAQLRRCADRREDRGRAVGVIQHAFASAEGTAGDQRRGEAARSCRRIIVGPRLPRVDAARRHRRRCLTSGGRVEKADDRSGRLAPARHLELHGPRRNSRTGDLSGVDERRRVTDPGEGMQLRLRSAHRHRVGGGRRKDVGVGAAQHERRTAYRVVRGPERGLPSRTAAPIDRAHRQRDRRVVVQTEPIAIAAQHRPRQGQPVSARMRTEPLRDRQQVVGRLVFVGPGERCAQIAGDAGDARRIDRGADVVEHQPRDRRLRQGREQHADQAAHRRTQPAHRGHVEPRKQSHHVGDVARHLIPGRIGQSIGFAAAEHIGADDTKLALHCLGQRVEIAPLPRQAMGADDDAARGRVAPFPVRHARQGLATQACHVA